MHSKIFCQEKVAPVSQLVSQSVRCQPNLLPERQQPVSLLRRVTFASDINEKRERERGRSTLASLRCSPPMTDALDWCNDNDNNNNKDATDDRHKNVGEVEAVYC